MLIMNLAKQMQQATPRNKEHVEENWLETIKNWQSGSYHRRMGKNGRRFHSYTQEWNNCEGTL